MSVIEQVEAGPRRPRGRPRSEDAVVIESKLLEVALREFLRHGYGGASMTRIVQAAGVSKTTLYSRYPSKDALFRAIVHEQIDRLSPSASLRSDAGPLALEQGLISYANHMIKLSLQGDLLGVDRLIYSESYQFPELGAAAAERTELGIKRISGFIRACAISDGVPCKDPKAVAEAFIFMIRGWYVNVILSNRKVSSAQREHWVRRAVHSLLSARSDW
jgi:TetR/AcrR family transcriptional regulator, mexJK operon transcriptional repressor